MTSGRIPTQAPVAAAEADLQAAAESSMTMPLFSDRKDRPGLLGTVASGARTGATNLVTGARTDATGVADPGCCDNSRCARSEGTSINRIGVRSRR